jgi:hypothetical protein
MVMRIIGGLVVSLTLAIGLTAVPAGPSDAAMLDPVAAAAAAGGAQLAGCGGGAYGALPNLWLAGCGGSGGGGTGGGGTGGGGTGGGGRY